MGRPTREGIGFGHLESSSTGGCTKRSKRAAQNTNLFLSTIWLGGPIRTIEGDLKRHRIGNGGARVQMARMIFSGTDRAGKSQSIRCLWTMGCRSYFMVMTTCLQSRTSTQSSIKRCHNQVTLELGTQGLLLNTGISVERSKEVLGIFGFEFHRNIAASITSGLICPKMRTDVVAMVKSVTHTR